MPSTKVQLRGKSKTVRSLRVGTTRGRRKQLWGKNERRRVVVASVVGKLKGLKKRE